MEGDIYPDQFPRPTHDLALQQLHPRPLLPIYPPPESLLHPPPPTLPRSTNADLEEITRSGFTFSTHLIPACFLRSTAPHTLPDQPPKHFSKEERLRYNEAVVSQVWSMRDKYTEQVAKPYDPEDSTQTKGYERILWNSLNRYTNDRATEDGITMVFFHANGFPKEIWEPSIAHLVSSPFIQQRVREIWTFEAVQHGDSAVINRKVLMTSGVYDWADHCRDILNFIVHFLPSEPAQTLPVHLAHIPQSESKQRWTNGLPANRRVVSIGHSFGGCTSAFAAARYPRLFSTAILVDPVIQPPRYNTEIKFMLVGGLVKGAVIRRNAWKNREEALALFSKSAYAAWDPAVLRSYVAHGLYTTPEGEVALKMQPIQEAICFSETEFCYATWVMLPQIPDNIPLHFIMPGMGKRGLGPNVERTKHLVWIRRENTSHARISGATHLIPQDKPRELAKSIEEYLLPKYGKIQSRL